MPARQSRGKYAADEAAETESEPERGSKRGADHCQRKMLSPLEITGEPLHDAQMTVRVACRGQEYPDKHAIIRESGKRDSQARLLFRRRTGRVCGSALGFSNEPGGEECDQQPRQTDDEKCHAPAVRAGQPTS